MKIETGGWDVHCLFAKTTVRNDKRLRKVAGIAFDCTSMTSLKFTIRRFAAYCKCKSLDIKREQGPVSYRIKGNEKKNK